MWRCIETLDVCLVFFLSHEPAFYLFLFSFRWPTESWLLTPLTYLISLCNRKIRINYIFIWINGQLRAYQDQSWLIVIAINQDSFRLININQHSYICFLYIRIVAVVLSVGDLAHSYKTAQAWEKDKLAPHLGIVGNVQPSDWLLWTSRTFLSFFFLFFKGNLWDWAEDVANHRALLTWPVQLPTWWMCCTLWFFGWF